MKLDKIGVKSNSLDLMQTLEECYEDEQKFWKKAEDYILHGVPGSDERGHWLEIRVRVRPSQIDLIGAVRDKHPPGMYKSQADLIRSLIAAGTHTHFEYFKRKKSMKWEELEEILISLNILGKKHRLEELRRDVKKAMNIAVNGSNDPAEKSKVIDILSKLDKKIDSL
jgi:hypothetical protein